MKAKLVKENLIEGVADKYLKNKMPQYDWEFDEFEKQYKNMTGDKLETVFQDGDWKLYKNPNTFKVLGPKVRGVITKEGDLYIENYSNRIHHDILKILYKKGIIKNEPKKNWTRKLPQESGFLTIQRFLDKPLIAIGESNKILYNEQDWKEKIQYYNDILKVAQKKNPKMKFTNKLVGIKSYKGKTKEEISKQSNTLK